MNEATVEFFPPEWSEHVVELRALVSLPSPGNERTPTGLPLNYSSVQDLGNQFFDFDWFGFQKKIHIAPSGYVWTMRAKLNGQSDFHGYKSSISNAVRQLNALLKS